MTTFTAVPTEDDIFTALRAFLQDILPPQATSPALVGFVVVVGQENRVPEPQEDNYIVLWPLRMPRLSTNFDELIGSGLQRGLVGSARQPAQVVIQIDVHGSQAFTNAMRISTMFRDGYAVDFFEAYPDIAPLFADDPRNATFISGEKQFEDRYVVEANLQVNFTMTRTTTSALTLTVDIIDAETPVASWPNGVASATGS